MATGQGVKRLTNGYSRRLTNSEFKRGYIFISMDRPLAEVLNTQNFEVDVNGHIVPNRCIDNSGRIQIPSDLRKHFKPETLWHLVLVSRSRLKLTSLG